MQVVSWARSFAPANDGNRRLARMPMTAITTNNSMRVKPADLSFEQLCDPPLLDIALAVSVRRVEFILVRSLAFLMLTLGLDNLPAELFESVIPMPRLLPV